MDDPKFTNLTPAQYALYVFMRDRSETIWAASWISSLESALTVERSDFDPGQVAAYEWLVTQAGGWFAWDSLSPDGPHFIPGSYDQLLSKSRARPSAPAAGDPAP